MGSPNDYKEWQNRYNELKKEAEDNSELDNDDPEKWDASQQRNHAENMLETIEQ